MSTAVTEEPASTKIFTCSQCPKVFVTRSNLKRHMENPNIHNIPYVRCRDQKRWKGHSKKVISKEESTESNNDRMRKWRAENREKNRQNDLRCRVYRLARQKFGEGKSVEKQDFVKHEIARRLGRRLILDGPLPVKSRLSLHPTNRQQQASICMDTTSPATFLLPSTDPISITNIHPNDRHHDSSVMNKELPFYSTPQQKIKLPSIETMNHVTDHPHHYYQTLQQQKQQATLPSSTPLTTASPAFLPDLSPHLPSEPPLDLFLQRHINNSVYDSLDIPQSNGSNSPANSCASDISLPSHPNSHITQLQQEQDNNNNNNNKSAHILLLSPLLSTTSSTTTTTTTTAGGDANFCCVLPSMHNLLSPSCALSSSSSSSASTPTEASATNIADQFHTANVQTQNDGSINILNEFVGVVLDYAADTGYLNQDSNSMVIGAAATATI
ncbi:hypothetical protein BDF20DRAFT_942553 [Mycotypha africana]|uniref:uncharacterized protein n=1 Tax=Mycotypha africana TaxID=64632 RepID=UPI0023003B0C|nr:uncharacterized protein BDF20DRAFT_942553 [Mycotypha africana]KAI8977595.1 hypothetical protein BDF20DRAFT_942553 [Mycotypha africana]